MSKYWFARSGSARYPHAMVPVTWQGRALMALVFVGALVAWFGFAAAGMIFHTNWIDRLPIVVAGLTPFAAFLLLAFGPMGDRKHTDADYKKGIVSLDTGDSK